MKPLELVFKLDDLPPEGRAFEGVLDVDFVREAVTGLLGELGFLAEGPAKASGTAYRSGQTEVVVDATLNLEVGFDCVRCLESRVIPVELRMDHVLSKEQPPEDAERALSEAELEDPDVHQFQGEQIDLKPILREDLLLELPMNPSCELAAAECRELPGETEAGEAPVDPRWAKLLEMKKNLN